MPAGTSPSEFLWGIGFAMLGSACYEFIKAQVLRQASADKGVEIGLRPRIDLALVGYAMLGAPLSAALLILIIHEAHGATGFGDPTWFQSAAGFMFVGPAGPKIVIKAVGYFVATIGSRFGGKAAP